MMRRTTVMLPDDLDDQLRYEARRRGVPLADLVREAVGSYLAGSGRTRRLSIVAIGEGPDDHGVADHADDEVARILDAAQRDHRAR